MNKQEIEKAIEYFRAGNFLGKSMDKHINVAISALEQQLNGGWISVSEKLPPLGACVICTVREHFRNQFELRYPVYYLQKTYENGYAFYFGDTNNPLLPDISEVVAWMPIPMPYEGGYQNAND